MKANNESEKKRKPFILRPKHRRFLEKLVEGYTQADAYIAAGFRAKNANVAAVSANKLLRKINENMDWQGILAAACPNTRLAVRLTELLGHNDGRVAVNAAGHLAKAKGWQPPDNVEDRRIQIVITTGGQPISIEKAEKDQKAIEVQEVKPKQIID